MLETLKARKEALEAQGKKGFTLMEMLIVIAIIAILIAIAIPIFTSQLERAGESTDAANIRSAYAEIMADAMTNQNSTIGTKTVSLQQTQNEWQNSFEFPANLSQSGTPSAKGEATVSYIAPTAATATEAGTDGVVVVSYTAGS